MLPHTAPRLTAFLGDGALKYLQRRFLQLCAAGRGGRRDCRRGLICGACGRNIPLLITTSATVHVLLPVINIGLVFIDPIKSTPQAHSKAYDWPPR